MPGGAESGAHANQRGRKGPSGGFSRPVDRTGDGIALASVTEALARLPEGERGPVLAHIARLVSMTPAKRAVLLALTHEER